MRSDLEESKLVRAAEWLAATRAGAWLIIHLMSPLDRFVMGRTKGRHRTAPKGTVPKGTVPKGTVPKGTAPTGTAPNGKPKLLLHHTGAKSGRARQTPLMCLPVEDHWLVVASKGGAAHHPAWYFNLKAHPAVTIDLNGETIPVQARELEGEEYEVMWRLATSRFKGFETYQARAAGRTIPLIRLDRRAS